MKKTVKLIIALVLAMACMLVVVGCKADNPAVVNKVVYGNYAHPNAYTPTAPKYGATVRVMVANNKITAIEMLADEVTGQVSVTASWTDAGKTAWTSGKSEYLSRFVGMTVEQVNAIKVIKDNEVPTSVNDKHYFLAGATQSSGRVVLAIQDALSKLSK